MGAHSQPCSDALGGGGGGGPPGSIDADTALIGWIPKRHHQEARAERGLTLLPFSAIETIPVAISQGIMGNGGTIWIRVSLLLLLSGEVNIVYLKVDHLRQGDLIWLWLKV